MEFPTIGHARKYFEDVERRYEEGSLIPTSKDGIVDRDRLLLCVTDLARLINDELEKIKSGQVDATHNLILLVEIRSKLILLLGKFEGFRYSQTYFIARAGIYGQDFC